MDIITVRGIVLREIPVFENDKYIHVLTQEYGVIEILVKGGQKLGSKNAGGTQLFSYSRLSLRTGKGKYYLDSSEPIQLFYKLREDLERLSLACYFADVACYAAGQHEQKEEMMRLFLNTLHFLSNGERSCELLKCIFEMRFMTIIGMMPDIVCCPVCMTYISESMCFDLRISKLYCSSCYKAGFDGEQIVISSSVVKALRHIVFADYDRLFNFRLSYKSIKLLGSLTERYLLIHLGREFKTLDFYNSLKK